MVSGSVAIVITAIAIVLCASAGAKLLQPRAFVEAVRGYGLLPPFSVPAVAAVVLIDEVLIVVSFVSGWLFPTSLLLALLTFLTFAMAVSISLIRQRTVECGCFGPTGEIVSKASLARLATIVLALSGAGAAIQVFGAAPRLLLASAGVGSGVALLVMAIFVDLTAALALVLPKLLHVLASNNTSVRGRLADQVPTKRR
jgi:hypothetical protein